MTRIPLALGAMMFGTTVDEATSFALLDRFVEAGGEWIDTANCYAFWASETGYGGEGERVLGRWLAARPGMRERVKISTKVGAEPLDKDDWPASREGLSASVVRSATEGSLRRLGVDHVDLLWAHMEDRRVPIEETAGALGLLAQDGLTDRVGTSNHPAWRVEWARGHALDRGLRPVDALQHSWSYLRPRPGVQPAGQNHRFGMLNDELIDLASTEGLEIWAYTALLGGAYDNPAKSIPQAYDHPGNARRLEALDSVAAELEVARGQVVLAWLIGGRQPIIPILGGSKVRQLDSALAAARMSLPEELRRRLDEVEG